MNLSKRWLPGLQILGEDQSVWLACDVPAGLVLTAMLVPVGSAVDAYLQEHAADWKP